MRATSKVALQVVTTVTVTVVVVVLTEEMETQRGEF